MFDLMAALRVTPNGQRVDPLKRPEKVCIV